MEEDTTELGINEKLNKLIEYMEKEKDEKKFKLPLKYRLQKMLFTRKQYVLLMLIRNNGSVIFKKVKPEDNTVKIKDTIYDASANYVLRYKRYPLIIQPEWNMKPFSIADDFKKATDEGTLTSTEKVIIAKMEKDQIKPKWGGSIKTLLIIGAIIIGALYALNYFGILKL